MGPLVSADVVLQTGTLPPNNVWGSQISGRVERAAVASLKIQ